MERIYRQSSLEERMMVYMQLEIRINPASIAVGLNRWALTRSRELRRNGRIGPKGRRGPGRPPVADGYRAGAVQARAQACTVTPRVARRLRPGTALWDQVTRYLKAGYSPEQIGATLALVHSDTPSLQVSYETTYIPIYAMPRRKLRTDVICWLCFGHAQTAPACARRRLAGRYS